MSSAKTPEYSAQAHMALSYARVCFLIFVNLRGLEIRMLRLVPEAERLTAPGLPSVVWV